MLSKQLYRIGQYLYVTVIANRSTKPLNHKGYHILFCVLVAEVLVFIYPTRIISRMPPKKTYTCNEYREEMRLLGLKKRLNEKNLSKTEKQTIEAEITKLEKALQMD